MEEPIFDKEYHLWRNDEYLGTAIWRDDENIGEQFLKMCVSDDGELISQVFFADKWKLVEDGSEQTK